MQDHITPRPEDILRLWFPPGLADADPEDHAAFWRSRMRGGMDETLIADWSEVTLAGAHGEFDHWAETPYGRLALVLVLDQFPRSVWRDTPAAYAQDLKAARLSLEALENGHFDALAHVWERQFLLISISHCEGPDHLERMDRLISIEEKLAEDAPPHLREVYERPSEQTAIVREVIRRFGRHPHRNPVLGRPSTRAEQTYINQGEFPHEREIKTPA
ncbi:DUF924 family protein [Mesobacterium pallidum]|uniref:DUF924 family protein n=1 Tax=Mesobacterium pallidum TaxID=2872037 RepID=UPI001EE2665D|nr:DUF924 family protein [Mesobacterium pallidum]